MPCEGWKVMNYGGKTKMVTLIPLAYKSSRRDLEMDA